MGFRVQTVLLGPEDGQYTGDEQPPIDFARITDAARVAESLGFDGVTVPEAGHDPFLPLAVAAEHTRRVSLGTNVAIAFPRSPLVTAQLAWDLQQLSGGRFQLGLGSQVRSHVERRYASDWNVPAGPRMRDYVACMKAMFETFQTGARPAFESDHYRFTLMNPLFNPGPIEHPDVPIHLAAVNPYMARLAGELCAGVRVHPIATFGYVRDVVLPAVEAGAAISGRTSGDLDMIGAPFLAVGRDDAEIAAAEHAIKGHIAFYSSTPTYHAVLVHHGWEEVGQELHQMSKERRWAEMPSRITDEMLDEWAVVAASGDLAASIAQRCAGLFSEVLLDLPPALRADEEWLAGTIASLQTA
ncbi:MAG: TIGR03617 family F420-dependent LLM class oxidoreductase [Acidimicrobiia bacterium]|nr:TIGR03617 family F420-dependent LLM class oxidoreductase [Acidimicrobiia bacterium]